MTVVRERLLIRGGFGPACALKGVPAGVGYLGGEAPVCCTLPLGRSCLAAFRGGAPQVRREAAPAGRRRGSAWAACATMRAVPGGPVCTPGLRACAARLVRAPCFFIRLRHALTAARWVTRAGAGAVSGRRVFAANTRATRAPGRVPRAAVFGQKQRCRRARRRRSVGSATPKLKMTCQEKKAPHVPDLTCQRPPVDMS